MKRRILAILIISALVTLSFTFASVKNENSDPNKGELGHSDSAPVGGFAIVDKN
jgi:hypothetical protein